MEPVTLISYTGALLLTISWLPQLHKTFKSQQTTGLSAFYFITLMGGFILFSIYGFMINEWPIILPNLFAMVSCSYILFVMFKNHHQKKIET